MLLETLPLSEPILGHAHSAPFFLLAPILAVGRYGESLLDIKDNGRISKLEQLNSLIVTEIRKLQVQFNW